MSVDHMTLQIFVYGEQLDAATQRSLGYQILESAGSSHATKEINSLAQLLQATPYPEHWPESSLFCSILLDDGQRIIAAVRYGVVDHTSSHRRGGIELFGVLASKDLRATTCLQIYRWLRERRDQVEDIRDLGGTIEMDEIGPDPAPNEVSVGSSMLPVRCWQNGCMVFSAPSPSFPDQHLALLTQVEHDDWQWLPLCSGVFPFTEYASRGPLVAWTQDLASVGLRLDTHPSPPVTKRASNWSSLLVAVLLVAFVGLLSANLYALLTLPDRIAPTASKLSQPKKTSDDPVPVKNPTVPPADDKSKDEFANALYELLQQNQQNGGVPAAMEKNLLLNYHRLAKSNKNLQVDSEEGQKLVGMISIMSNWNADGIAQTVVDEFKDEKTVDRQFIKLISERIRNRFIQEFGKTP